MRFEDYAAIGVPDDIALKLARAHYHLKTVKDECTAFTELKAYELIPKAKDNGAKHVYRLHVLTQPGDEFGPVIGDFLHNARAALDYIAFALARQVAAPPSTTQFPIFKTHGDWIGQAGNAVKGMSVRAQAIIRSLQPYRARQAPDEHALWHLRELSNRDKHRALNVVAGGAGMMTHGYWPFDPNRPHVELATTAVIDGAIMATVIPPVPTPKVNVELGASLYILFEDSTPFPRRFVEPMLNRIIWYIDAVVLPAVLPELA